MEDFEKDFGHFQKVFRKISRISSENFELTEIFRDVSQNFRELFRKFQKRFRKISRIIMENLEKYF